ncbi:hypothetical protein ACIRPK_22455 [Kitasatospora sp. NPDC101801]|uniref:hypothetical protein n=1 Tax=Kitasatospora sp. NPDC101801 TaxID=3364103 RepID=UPI00382D72AC
MNEQELIKSVGRRTALRYLAVGTLMTVVSACSGNGSGGGPTKQALKAFATGRWEYSSNADHVGVLTVTADGRWSTTQWNGLEGRWELTGSSLTIRMDGRPGRHDDFGSPFLLQDMTESVDEGFSGRYELNDGWSSDIGESAEVSYRKGELAVFFPGYYDGGKGAGLTVTCTRQK